MSLRGRAPTIALLALAALAPIAGAALVAPGFSGNQSVHFADADNRSMTALGARTYARQCAPCHGRRLQGQPFWRLIDRDSRRRAPALDDTGRAWTHSDEDLFHMIKYGRFDGERPERASHMPAFQGRLDDHEVVSTVAFLKARWPLGLRALQAMRNPSRQGMPAGAETTNWRLPATCSQQESAAANDE